MKTQNSRNPIDRSPLRSGLLFIALALGYFALSPAPNAFGVVPPPDGGYPGFNTAEGQNALLHLTTGTANTALGWLSLENVTTGSFNTGVGAGTLVLNSGDQNTANGAAALLLNTTGSFNTANGALALFNNTEGSQNTANGYQALSNNTSGVANTATGAGALFNNTTGIGNIALGASAGFFLNTGSNNIDIGNAGSDESDTIRIGSTTHTRAFIAGIRGATTANAAIPVLIDTAGQLGTMSSSARFKNDIKPMDKASDALLGLKPVTFHYKSDARETPQFGLIAEEVAKVNPDLVVRDADGEIYTVRYDAVNAMLLNEFLKEQRKVQEQEATITQLKNDFQATVAQLATRLDEQAAQIQKVSAQLEASKPASQVVSNNQ